MERAVNKLEQEIETRPFALYEVAEFIVMPLAEIGLKECVNFHLCLGGIFDRIGFNRQVSHHEEAEI